MSDVWKECIKLPVVVHYREQREGETHVSTREGITPVKPDDYIMRGVNGEEYPIGREIFEKTYTTDVQNQTAKAEPAPLVRLSDEEIDQCYGPATRAFKRFKYSVRGQITTPQDSFEWHFANAIMDAMERVNRGRK